MKKKEFFLVSMAKRMFSYVFLLSFCFCFFWHGEMGMRGWGDDLKLYKIIFQNNDTVHRFFFYNMNALGFILVNRIL